MIFTGDPSSPPPSARTTRHHNMCSLALDDTPPNQALNGMFLQVSTIDTVLICIYNIKICILLKHTNIVFDGFVYAFNNVKVV